MNNFLNWAHLPKDFYGASTSPKDPAYSDIKYVEALIGPNTVNTIPLETLEAYRDHGDPSLRLESNVEQAYEVMSELHEVGIDINKVTKKLEDDGVEKFIHSFDKLMEVLIKKSSK